MLPLLFGATSCVEDYLGGDTNQDPNKPSDVPLSGLLPNVQIVLADTYGGDHSRFNSMFVQQVEGVARQWSSFNQYDITSNRFDAAWQNWFESSLVNINTMQEIATTNEYNHYLGIVNTLEAFGLMMATDAWGDMPYTEAALGAANTSPSYDTQASLYTAVHALLDEALTLFGQSSGALVPGGDDVIYGGDIDLWTKAVNGLKARAYLHEGSTSQALASAQASFEGRDEDMSIVYPDANDAGQWYRFNRDRTGDLEFHPTMKAMMEGLGDTDRLAILDNTFITDHPYLTADFKQDFISYREIQFIIAETASSSADEWAAFEAGVQASFEELGLTSDDADSYIEANGWAEGGLTDEIIMTQKYIGMFVQPEVWTDWRRTGLPALSPVSGTEIPRRWLYSSDEFLFNSNAPDEGDVTLYAPRVSWDN